MAGALHVPPVASEGDIVCGRERGEAWYVAGNGAKLARKTSTLNPDKYRIMKQRNWRCDITPLERDLGYQPRYLLEEGVKETIEWYKEEGWL